MLWLFSLKHKKIMLIILFALQSCKVILMKGHFISLQNKKFSVPLVWYIYLWVPQDWFNWKSYESTHLQSSHFLQKNIKKCHVGKIWSQRRLWEFYCSVLWYSNNCLSLKAKENKYNFMGLLGQRHLANYWSMRVSTQHLGMSSTQMMTYS